MKNKKFKNIETIDLFCGIGGLSFGLNKVGLNVSKGFDIEKYFKFGYEENNTGKYILKDVKDIRKEDLFDSKTKTKVLVGCAPCQPFSSYTIKYKYNEDNNEKWCLINEFLRLIKISKPDIISLENVPKLRKQKIFLDFVNELKKEKYFVSYSVIDCSKYRIPQKRKRLVLFASKFSELNIIEKDQKKLSIKKLFEKNKLNKINAGETDKEDFLHSSAGLSKLNIERIKASKQGGTWLDWKEELRSNCHKKPSGKSFANVYGRMDFNKPSPTLTTRFYGYGTGRFGHPIENRAISIREGALIQTFPKDYKFCKKEDFTITKVAQSIGNAVPPKLAEIIGQSIMKHLEVNNVR